MLNFLYRWLTFHVFLQVAEFLLTVNIFIGFFKIRTHYILQLNFAMLAPGVDPVMMASAADVAEDVARWRGRS